MRNRIRRVAVYGFLAFVAVSAALHFTLGSTVATLFPTWRYATPPDQAISIISLSRNVREESTPRPTPPPPSPKLVMRTSTHIAPLKYREMAFQNQAALLKSIHAPARRKSNLIIVGPKLPKPGTKEAPAVSNGVQPTPSPGVAGAKVDTGGNNDEVNGATVWGDDNPVRVLKLADLSLASPPPQPIKIEVDVGPDGNIVNVRLLQSSGDANLDAMALDAARKTVFAPATLNGLPVHGTIVLEYPPTPTTT